MSTRTFARQLTCTSCGNVNVIIDQPEFKDLCSVLLAGGAGVIICSRCGREDVVRFTGELLEVVIDE